MNLPAPLKAYWDRLDEWLASLAPRERLIVIAGAIVLGVFLLHAALWQPLVRAHESRARALDDSRAIASRLEAAAAIAQQARAGGGANRSTSLLGAIDQATHSPTLGKPPARIQPEGDRSVNVWIEDVPFDNLVRWLAELESRYAIVPVTADIERQPGAGLVNARLALGRP